MAKSEKRKLGDIGEAVAARYLENKGYSIIERNYWKPWGEIDIIAKKQNKLYFVEVKTVSRESIENIASGSFRPEENMHANKVRRLYRAVQTYLLQRKVDESIDWQIDLACVYLEMPTHKAKVEILENIIL